MMNTINEDDIIKNLKECNRFSGCSINICPLDLAAGSRNELSDETCCPFCLKKKSRTQKGMRTLAPNSVLVLVPKSNVKMLNRRNQRRWHELNT